MLATIESDIPSAGICVVSRNFVDESSVYISIKSRLVMTRPLVFTYEGSKMDVFHDRRGSPRCGKRVSKKCGAIQT